jgi:hypothetical protein
LPASAVEEQRQQQQQQQQRASHESSQRRASHESSGVAFASQSIEIASDEGEPGTVGTALAVRFFSRQTTQDAT